jgi:hypothetical protein
MKDIQEQLNKLRAHIADCERMRDRSKNAQNRDLFDSLIKQHRVLAAQLERSMTDQMPVTFLGRKTYEPFPTEDL